MEIFRRFRRREAQKNTPHVIDFTGEFEGIKGFYIRLELCDPYIETLKPATAKKIQDILVILGATVTGILVTGSTLESAGSNINQLLEVLHTKTLEGARLCRSVSKEVGDI